MSIAYRPRGVPELIDAAFQLMRRHYVPLAVLAGITYIPSLVFVLLVGAPAQWMESDGGSVAIFAIMALLSPFLLVWYAIGLSAMIAAAAEGYQGRAVDPSAALKRALRRWRTVVLSLLAKYILIFLATMVVALVFGIVGAAGGMILSLLILPGFILPLWVAIRYFAIPALPILEEIGIGDALRRSAHLSEGMRWTILWTYVVVYAIVFVFWIAAAAIATIVLRNPVISNVIGQVLSILALPLIGTMATVLYFDARIRKEGLDIELMARELSAEPARETV